MSGDAIKENLFISKSERQDFFFNVAENVVEVIERGERGAVLPLSPYEFSSCGKRHPEAKQNI